MQRRHWYLLLICALAVITYLDRVCISVAGPRMRDALGISPQKWGWVGTSFLLAYAIFEIPSGHLGDRIGARRVLTRIVLWWSAFTALTGMVSAYPLLLLVRFLFGAGEAGAFPNAAVAISNWFPIASRGRAFGLLAMSSQIGGALSPLLVLPIQRAYGWRMSFYVFACLGAVWAAVWYWQYRDSPEGRVGAPRPERASWRPLLRSRNLWAIMGLTFAYIYTMSFYQTWLHTYLAKGRGFSEQALSLSALPYIIGAGANVLGGLVCDGLAPRVGLTWSRRWVGVTGMAIGAVSIALLTLAASQWAIIACLSLAYAGITFQQPIVFTACLDIGGARGGAVTGFMNTAGQLGGAVSSAAFGYIVGASGSYGSPLWPMSALLVVGAVLWTRVDVSAPIEWEARPCVPD